MMPSAPVREAGPNVPTVMGWRAIMQSLNRPYPVTMPMVALVMLVPVYLVIADYAKAGSTHAPAIALDNWIPVRAGWALIYGSLYAFLIVIPVLLVRQPQHIRRTVYAYLMVWIVSYIVFLMYPTEASRPAAVAGDGFATWSLRFLYDADPPYNCFPSIHVAHSFVSALTVQRVHKRLGAGAVVCAVLVALSTLYTKQHYIVDVIAGIALALIAYAIFIKKYPAESIPDAERRIAPLMAASAFAVICAGVAAFWIVYQIGGAA